MSHQRFRGSGIHSDFLSSVDLFGEFFPENLAVVTDVDR